MSDEAEQGLVGAFGGMDATCPACGEEVGGHTLRKFTECAGERGLGVDRPYHEVKPQDAVSAVMNGMRERFKIGGDVLIADHVQASALVVAGEAGPLTIRSPAVLHEFQIGLPTGPAAVVKIMFAAGTVQVMRSYGRLLRDTSNGAANAAERAQADPRWRPGR